MDKKFRLVISFSLLILLIFIISRAIKIENLRDIIWDFPKEQLLLFLGISLTISFLKAWRFLLLLHNTNIPITLWEVSKVYLASQTTTPLPGGEALRAILVHHETDTPIKNTTGAILTQGFLELTSAGAIMIIGSFYYEQVRPFGLFAFILLTIISVILLKKSVFLYFLNKIPNKKLFVKLRSRLKFVQKGFLTNIDDPKHGIFKTFIISIGTHLLGGLLVMAIARSYGINMNYFVALFVYAAGIVIQGLSIIIPAGLGLTEGGMTGLLLINNIPLDKSIAIVLIFRIITLLFSIIIGLFFFLFYYSYDLLIAQQKAYKK